MIIWQSRVGGTLYRIKWENGWFIPAYCYKIDVDRKKNKWTETNNKLALGEILHWIGEDLGEDILII